MQRVVVLPVVSLFVLAGCHANTSMLPPQQNSVASNGIASNGFANRSIVSTGLRANVPWTGKINHVIIIYQENRSVDNLFNGLPGADTQSWGLDHNGRHVNLQPVSLTAGYDLGHTHTAWKTEYANGRLNGFDLEPRMPCHGGNCPPRNRAAYGFVPRSEVQPYFDMASKWGFGDRMFQTNQGPSFPSHQYIVSGTSTISAGSSLRASENPRDPSGKNTGGCDAPKGSSVLVIDQAGNENQTTYPCFTRPTLMDLLGANSLTWRYYQYAYQPNLWAAPDAVLQDRQSPQYQSEVAAPSRRVLDDIAHGSLAAVSWVTPERSSSDHAGFTNGTGPSWVASIVNAVGQSQYWNSTVIFVTWDDWGGWYDHVTPPVYNSYELGFRVPLLVISPYAKPAYVSHTQHEFGSILKFTEETFGLNSLGTTDVRADDLSDFFDFTSAPRSFTPVRAALNSTYFLSAPQSNDTPDDD